MLTDILAVAIPVVIAIVVIAIVACFVDTNLQPMHGPHAK